MTVENLDKITTEKLHNFNVNNEESRICWRCLCFSHQIDTAAKKSEDRLGRGGIKELGQILKYKDVSIEMKTKVINTMVLLVSTYECGG